MKYLITGIIVGGVALLFLSGALWITTDGCTLPIDIVAGDVCVVGSLGASLGASLALTLLFGLVGAVFAILGAVVRNKPQS